MKTYNEIAEYLTETEKRGLRKDIKKRIASFYNDLPETAIFKLSAISGIAKKDWYQRASDTLKSLYGEDSEKFIGLLASTSPQQTVEKNLAMTIEIFNAWRKAGKPIEGKKLNSIVKACNLRCRLLNCKRALRGQELSGLKVRSFYKNLIGDKQAVTIDTWMSSFADIKRDVYKKFTYLAYTAKIRETAKELNWLPCEVQETVWSYIKAKTEGLQVKDVPEFSELLTQNEAIKSLIAEGLS